MIAAAAPENDMFVRGGGGAVDVTARIKIAEVRRTVAA